MYSQWTTYIWKKVLEYRDYTSLMLYLMIALLIYSIIVGGNMIFRDIFQRKSQRYKEFAEDLKNLILFL